MAAYRSAQRKTIDRLWRTVVVQTTAGLTHDATAARLALQAEANWYAQSCRRALTDKELVHMLRGRALGTLCALSGAIEGSSEDVSDRVAFVVAAVLLQIVTLEAFSLAGVTV